MSSLTSKIANGIFSIGTTLLIASVSGAIARSTWKALRNGPPPANPTSPETGLKDALLWTLATGITASVTRLIIMRGAEAGLRSITRKLPAKAS